ncbi:MAG: hypothetical protein AAGB13_10380 [Cyanobacteria bacterium P01_F01_bin.33]
MKDTAIEFVTKALSAGDVTAYLTDELPRRGSRWVLLYVDLRFFRTYSQFYGFAAKQRMLTMLRSLIVAQLGPDCSYFQVGTEALLAFTTTERAEADAAAICRRWQEARGHLYRAQDLERGFSIGSGRHGTICRYPLVEVSIGLVDGSCRDRAGDDNIADICSTAIVTNALARTQQRSTYVTERQLLQLQPFWRDCNVFPALLNHLRSGGYAIVIEPDAALAFLLQVRLELFGYDVCVTTSPVSVPDLVRDRTPDIVIADGDNPLALCRDLYQRPALANALLAMLANSSNLLHVLEAGADIVMPKPFAIEELLYWLQRLRPSPFKSMECQPETTHLGISNPR